MRRILITLIILLAISGQAYGWGLGVGGLGVGAGSRDAIQPASWDLLDENFSDITDWTDGDTGTGASTEDPEGQLKMDSGSDHAGDNDVALRMRDIGSIPNTFTVEIKLYHDALGTLSDNDRTTLVIYQSDEAMEFACSTDGAWSRYGPSYTWLEIGSDLVKSNASAEWQIWRFCVTLTATSGAGTCDVYLNDSIHGWTKVATGQSCTYSHAGIDGQVCFFNYGLTTANRISHVDYLKIASGITAP